MSLLVAAGLAGASAAVLVAVPRAGQLRLAGLSHAAPPTRLPRMIGPLGLAAAGGAVLLGPVPALLAAAGGAAAWAGAVRRRRLRAAAAEQAAAVEACAALAAELRAGRFPAEALAAAADLACGPLEATLRGAAATAGLGGDAAAVLRAPVGATAVPEVARALAACWSVCAGSGNGLAAAVSRLEEGLRADAAQRRAIEAELAGPRATAALLALLPLVGLVLAAGLGADPLHVLLHTPAGLVCLLLGLALDALGLLWTARLVDRAARGG